MKNKLPPAIFFVLLAITFLLIAAHRYLHLTVPLGAGLSSFSSAVSSDPTSSLTTYVEISPPARSLNLLPDYQLVDSDNTVRLSKLSGIVFHPERQTFFAVSDKGYIFELAPDGTLIYEKEIDRKLDFEGITFSPVSGLLYIAIEGQEAILEVSPETLEAGHKIPIDLVFEGKVLLTAKGKGVEGITFVPTSDGVPKGTFYLVNQSDEFEGIDASIVFEIVIEDTVTGPVARIVRYFPLGVTDMSGIHYISNGDQLLIISDANNMMFLVSLSGEVLEVWPLPGDSQEGVTIDEDGFLYIAQDKKSQLLKFRPRNAPAPN